MVIVMAEGRGEKGTRMSDRRRRKDPMTILTLCMRAMHDTCGKRVVHQK